MFQGFLRAAAMAGVALAAIGAGIPAAAEFPPISDAERAMTAVPGQPNARSVVLFRRGELQMMDPARHEVSSHLTVHVRLKILTDAGKVDGDVRIAHSGTLRLQGFEGRTVLPDGSIVPVAKDATFRRVASQSRRVYVTSVAFPAVQAGAILDYQYTVFWDSIFFLDPWYFQDRVPVLHSEVIYDIPTSLQVAFGQNDPMHVGIKTETAKSHVGTRFRAWADNLPPIPEEIDSLPFADMAAHEILLPTAFTTTRVLERLLESWPTVCQLLDGDYEKALRRDGDAVRKAREIGAAARNAHPAAGAAARDVQRREATALYDFVRDEIATDDSNSVWVGPNATVGGVLADRRGTPAEKALLLEAMLAAVKIDSRLVWAADRESGSVDLGLPNPAWFDRVLVAAQVDGQRVFLDPAERSLAFGHLAAGYEGTNALLYDRDKPEAIVLPESAFSDNVRRVRLDLTLDTAGRITGTGTLTLLGQPAWRRTRWSGDAGSPTAAWEGWLRERFPGYDVGAVKVAEQYEEARVEVSWTLSQHPEEALGDQAVIAVGRPLGSTRQPFPAGGKRLSAAVFDYAGRDETEIILRWPPGWQPDVLPRSVDHQSAAGAVVAHVETDGAKRTLVYTRRFDNTHRKAATPEQFGLLQALFEEAAKSDAQALAFSHR
jgi:hypothetical protein